MKFHVLHSDYIDCVILISWHTAVMDVSYGVIVWFAVVQMKNG